MVVRHISICEMAVYIYRRRSR